MFLIAGATGYVGGLLADELSGRGSPVRCMARTPEKARERFGDRCEIVEGDVLEPETLGPGARGGRLAYYLVHSMGRGGDGDFVERDRRGARNFAEAAQRGRGRADRLPRRPRARASPSTSAPARRPPRALASTGIPLTYFRAAIVIGSGSESLMTIAYLVKRLPAMVTPSWTDDEDAADRRRGRRRLPRGRSRRRGFVGTRDRDRRARR